MSAISRSARTSTSSQQSAADEQANVAIVPSFGRRYALAFLPVGIFAGLAVALGVGLGRDPSVLPSPLIGKPIPEFSLPPVQGRTLGLSTADLKGEVSLVNVFASWCVACREEHPVFMQLSQSGAVSIHGINYKDRPQDAAEWLDTLGDPYTRTGSDLDGRVAIDWGVYGVPETFVIDAQGRIALKQVGPITPEIYRDKIGPLIEALRSRAQGGAS
ncbi:MULTISPECIES: DsbE family thiol:disulfide interchange protein [Aurantimonadaceae]|uniref:DsbE family thiol:disulfide interchange protein n=1 Tax=Jiella pelagia TaxID=2986949 RepID=A0ABY7C6L6_9HYPH|nr:MULTISPECIES: DsbE family thiol:disulfide interchange protein [Aurantimonadaceae]WAP71411.1 DsbE family thiol:disulfide interchange protein [Jiella pelagia]